MRTIVPLVTSRNFATDLWNEVDRFFNDFSPANLTAYNEREWSAPMDVYEKDDSYSLSVDLPGVKKDEVKVEVKDNILTIEGERKRDFKQDHKAKVVGRSYGSFKRSFVLPQSVDANSIEARFEDGVLELHLPKSAKTQSRRIEITGQLESKNVLSDAKKKASGDH